MLPLVAAADLAEKLGLTAVPVAQAKVWVDEYIDYARRCMTSEGGFDYYPGGRHADPYLTAHATDVLLTARELGYTLPADMLERVASYLDGAVREGHRARGDSATAYALDVLSRLGRANLAEEQRLYAERGKLAVFARTDLARALARRDDGRPLARALLDEVLRTARSEGASLVVPASARGDWWWAWDSDRRNTALALLGLLQVDAADRRVHALLRGLLAEPAVEGRRWTNTQEDGLAVLAMARAIRAGALATGGVTASLSVNGETRLDARRLAAGDGVTRVRLDGAMAAPGGRAAVSATGAGDGPLYVGAYLRYRHRPDARLPAEDRGFKVTRRYEDQDGAALGVIVPQGSLVRVTLDVVPAGGAHNVVVDDPLPAGFVAVNAALATEDVETAEAKTHDDTGWRSGLHREMRDDRVVHYLREVVGGVAIRLQYLARAATPGRYLAPGTHAERMYEPHVRGRAATDEVEIGR